MSGIEEFISTVMLIVGFYGGLAVWIKAENDGIRGAGMIISVVCFRLFVERA